MPRPVASSSAAKVSSSVAGRRCRRSSPTGAVRILAFAEIEAQHLAEIEQQLLGDRPVEAVLVADRRDLLRRRVVAGERRRRVGRHHPDQQKGDDQQPEQRRDRSQHARRTKRARSGTPRIGEIGAGRHADAGSSSAPRSRCRPGSSGRP